MENTTARFSEVKTEGASITAKTTASPAPVAPPVALVLASGMGSASATGDGAKPSEDGGDGDGCDDMEVVEMEHLFDQVLMPSDVGKVFDRLVISAQHVTKLDAVAKGQHGFIALIFEDHAVAGRLWCFRYSYWSRSQIHCLTKGWGLFVREKGLDAGDTVSFFRSASGAARGRLYIDCKRRANAAPRPVPAPVRQLPPRPPSIGVVHRNPMVPVGMPTILESMPLVHRPAAKRARLFGVYLDEPLRDGGELSNDTGA